MHSNMPGDDSSRKLEPHGLYSEQIWMTKQCKFPFQRTKMTQAERLNRGLLPSDQKTFVENLIMISRSNHDLVGKNDRAIVTA